MNFLNILKDIEKADPEIYERLSGRRQLLKSFGSKVAVASLPIAFGTLLKKAYGKSTATSAIVTSLNFALELEYLEYTFFRTGVNTGSLIPSTDQPGFQTIMNQEQLHIDFLGGVVTTLGGTPFVPNYYTDPSTIGSYVPAAYDFTAGGAYPLVFADYATFLVIAQVFEDAVIHAYKGQLPTLIGNNTLFTQIMEMQCTEARHSAHVRLVRRMNNAVENPAPWITNNIAPPFNSTTNTFLPFYNGDFGVDLGEDNVNQTGVNVSALGDTYSTSGQVPQISATAAFDETMDQATLISLLSPFIKS